MTGAARGIGAAIAERLPADGLEVRHARPARGLRHRARRRARPVPRRWATIDVCVANAGVTTTIAPAHRMTAEQWQRDIDVNLTGAFRTMQACLGGMRERRFGRIVVISSVAALGGLPGQVAYAASKAGQLGHGAHAGRRERRPRHHRQRRSCRGWSRPSRCWRCRRRCASGRSARRPRAGWWSPARSPPRSPSSRARARRRSTGRRSRSTAAASLNLMSLGGSRGS